MNEGIKELCDHIGTYGNDDTYFKANYLKYENDLDMTVGEANKSNQELRNYLINLVFIKLNKTVSNFLLITNKLFFKINSIKRVKHGRVKLEVRHKPPN